MSSSLFPPNPPRSTSKAEDIIRNDWAAFQGLKQLADHWARPAWPDGASAVYWLIDLGWSTDLRAHADACQQNLADIPDLDPVPLGLLHLTICRVGATSEVDDDTAATIAQAAQQRTRTMPPMTLSIGPLAGSAGAVRFSVTPWTELLHLHQDLVAARNAVLGGPPSNGFRPHVSIAYNGRPRLASPLTDRVNRLRHLPPVNVEVTVANLVRLQRDGHVYRWQTIATTPLHASIER